MGVNVDATVKTWMKEVENAAGNDVQADKTSASTIRGNSNEEKECEDQLFFEIKKAEVIDADGSVRAVPLPDSCTATYVSEQNDNMLTLSYLGF